MSDRAWPFLKMHGLGNDFVVLDARARAFDLTPARVRAIASRGTGVGCDQLVVLAPPSGNTADATMLIYNADGSEVAACGNASRCVAWLLMKETGLDKVVFETKAGLLDAESRGPFQVAVDMGPARLDWREIPVAEAVDTLHLGIAAGPLADPVGVSMGNPHAVFFVDDAESVDLAALGRGLEHHPMFPERANIEVAQVLTPPDAEIGRIRMRVWERGAGITMACGTGACATLVAAARRGLSPRKAEITLDGGQLTIEWLKDGHVLMTGPVAVAFAGTLDSSLLP
ncbi:Diaminopimelate epimerase [Magnetospirillum sp. XM-1]|uniref:diaminopimelate epimerase n=1 Tax=Magnetospirillum sp. XM-1 TaxID=1663591 RepID=UPI00073DEB37|nr:diaminopimelate epimerase [Magnetospirillum sp. XM-1]CUW38215.1 Diaminopimelate epimerase [Magnetospirillum sp. XM-1]